MSTGMYAVTIMIATLAIMLAIGIGHTSQRTQAQVAGDPTLDSLWESTNNAIEEALKPQELPDLQLYKKDTIYSPPSTFEELFQLCMYQANGDSNKCNAYFNTCHSAFMTVEECYAANFIDINVVEAPESVRINAGQKLVALSNALTDPSIPRWAPDLSTTACQPFCE